MVSSIKTSLPTTTRIHAHTDIYIYIYACVCDSLIEIGRQFQKRHGFGERKKCTCCTAPAGSMGYTVWLYHLQSARDSVQTEKVRNVWRKECWSSYSREGTACSKFFEGQAASGDFSEQEWCACISSCLKQGESISANFEACYFQREDLRAENWNLFTADILGSLFY